MFLLTSGPETIWNYPKSLCFQEDRFLDGFTHQEKFLLFLRHQLLKGLWDTSVNKNSTSEILWFPLSCMNMSKCSKIWARVHLFLYWWYSFIYMLEALMILNNCYQFYISVIWNTGFGKWKVIWENGKSTKANTTNTELQSSRWGKKVTD